MEELLKKIQAAMYTGNKTKVEKMAREALSAGIDPLKIIEEGMRPGLSRVGNAFDVGELFLPELVGAGEAALAVSDLVVEALGEGEEIPRKGTIAMGTVKGDVHDIGKNLVKLMLLKLATLSTKVEFEFVLNPSEFFE